MSAIPWLGQDIVEFIWGGFSVSNATLNRFFALHFVLPFVLAALVMMHLISLHDSAGSNNPLGISGNYDRLPFAPYFIFKDLVTIFLFILVVAIIVFYMPNILGDSENYVMANPMQTPAAIVPEWYLLPFYAILRSIPNKLLGVIAMFSAILILLSLPFADLSRSRGTQFRPFNKNAFFIFASNLLILMVLGAKHVESPFVEFGQIATVLYFAYFLVIIPSFNLLENGVLEMIRGNYKSSYISNYNTVIFPKIVDASIFINKNTLGFYLCIVSLTILYNSVGFGFEVLYCQPTEDYIAAQYDSASGPASGSPSASPSGSPSGSAADAATASASNTASTAASNTAADTASTAANNAPKAPATEEEIDPDWNRAPWDVYQDLKTVAKHHALELDDPQAAYKLDLLRAFIESKTSDTEGHSLPSGSRSEILSSLNKLDSHAQAWGNYTNSSPSSQPFDSLDWVQKHCWYSGVNKGVDPGRPLTWVYPRDRAN